MATINQLQPSISTMSQQEAIALILEIRNRRKVKIKLKKKKKPQAKVARLIESRKNPKQQDLFQIVSSMSASQASALLKKLKTQPKGNPDND